MLCRKSQKPVTDPSRHDAVLTEGSHFFTIVDVIFQFFFSFANFSKILVRLCHYGVLSQPDYTKKKHLHKNVNANSTDFISQYDITSCSKLSSSWHQTTFNYILHHWTGANANASANTTYQSQRAWRRSYRTHTITSSMGAVVSQKRGGATGCSWPLERVYILPPSGRSPPVKQISWQHHDIITSSSSSSSPLFFLTLCMSFLKQASSS